MRKFELDQVFVMLVTDTKGKSHQALRKRSATSVIGEPDINNPVKLQDAHAHTSIYILVATPIISVM